MPEPIRFDDARASTYRKTAEVLAFRSDDAFRFEKSWGVQESRAGSWVIVSLDASGEPTGDVYGCDGKVFDETYEPAPSGPHRFRKKATVRAYQPGRPFVIDTVLADEHRETKDASTTSTDAWIVRAPGGEAYPVENDVFERTYERVGDGGAG